jgi:hypothetical protein
LLDPLEGVAGRERATGIRRHDFARRPGARRTVRTRTMPAAAEEEGDQQNGRS